MSREVETRIVEMRFDNNEFEKNAKTSMGTLSKLKEALKIPNSTKALEDVGKAAKDVKLDGIASGVEALTNRFSTMGIVGMRIIENITDGLMNKLGQAVNFVTNSIVSGGVKRAMNIENAHFQLQALLKDETKVQAVMADAMESVDGTAYAYDEAAKAASQFAASGIQAGEEMLGALKGITGVAAMTNSDFESISTIFTTVAGNGRLMGDQLLQLSSRGLNAASTLSDYFQEVKGLSNTTEADIREMVSAGKLSFKEFADAMTWAFGDSAKRANETFTGAMSNMKAALARTGAGFISPLVEQEGELVKLFNALRVQINNFNSTLIFDEAKSAISGLSKEADILNETIGRMVTSGEIGMETIAKNAIGAKKSEEELAEVSGRLSSVFDDMKEKGYATNEMLNAFSDEGMKVSYTITKYLNGVQEGSIKASNAMKMAVKDITGGTRVNVQEISKLAEEGKISVDIFAASLATHADMIGKDASYISETITAMMSNVKSEGHLTMEMLKEFNHNNMNASKAIMDYINGVKDGSIRASYATRTAINEMTDDVLLTTHEINKFVEEGAISFDIFQSAMENAYGDSKALSKQFTDSFLDMVGNIVKAVEEIDLTKPMEAFYYWVETGKNVGKGLLSILKPIARAFKNVFGAIEMDTIVDFSVSVEELTAKMKLSEENSKNLEDAFTGIFDVVKLLIDIFFKLLGAIIPINKPVLEMGDGFLGLVGSIGRALSEFTKTIRESKKVREAYDTICEGVKFVSDGFSDLIERIGDFIDEVQEMPIVKNIVKKVTSSLTELTEIKNPMARLSETLKTFRISLKDINWETQNTGFAKFQEIFQKFIDKAMENKGFADFVNNVKEFGIEIKTAFSLDAITEKVDSFRTSLEKLTEWFKTSVIPTFSDISFGDVLATGGGLGLIYALMKAAKAFSRISVSLQSIPSVLGTISKTLVAYQKDLNASAILKIAGAIAILAVSLTILSFANQENLINAALAFSLVAAVLFTGVSAFNKTLAELKKAVKKGKPIEDALKTLTSGIKLAIVDFGKAVKIKALGSAIKDLAKTVVIIAVTIAGLGLLWKKDKELFEQGLATVEYLGVCIVGIMIVMSYLGEVLQKGTKGFAMASGGVLALSVSLLIILTAINKLFKMEIPGDYQQRLDILGNLFIGLAVLAITVAGASKIAGGEKMSGGTFLGMAALVYLTVSALKKIFEMEIPDDYRQKLNVLGEIFIGLALLMLAIGKAAQLSEGNSLKAFGTLVGICMAIAVAVGAIVILSVFPADRVLQGAEALSLIMVALGMALYGAGQISDASTWKSILSMAVMLGVIVVALGVISMINGEKLLKSVLSIGAVLVAMTLAFKEASSNKKIENAESILAMCIALTVIAIALVKLSEQPWENLLASAASISAVLLAFAVVFNVVAGERWSKNNPKKIGTFLALTVALIPIAAALKILSEQPWQGMLVAVLALGAVLAGLIGVLFLIDKTNVGIKSTIAFVAAAVALVPIAAALKMLCGNSWSDMWPAMAGLAAMIATLSVALIALSFFPASIAGVIAFVAASIALIPIAAALKILAGESWDSLLPGLIGLVAMVATLSVALIALSFFPTSIAGVIAFVAAAVALIPIAYVLKILSGLTFEQIATGLIALAGAMVIIGAAGLLIGPISPLILALSAALIVFGAAISVVGVGLVIFVSSLITTLDLLTTLLNSLGDLPSFITVGKQLIEGFIEGILQGFDSLISTVEEVAGNVLGTIKEVLGIHSPSTEAAKLGKNTDEGFALGLEEGSVVVDEATNSVFGGLLDNFDVSSIFNIGKDASGNFGEGLKSGGVDISTYMSELTDSSGIDISSFTNLGSEASGNFGEGLLSGEGGITEAISQMTSSGNIDLSSFTNLGSEASENFGEGLTSGDMDFNSVISEMTSSDSVDLSGFTDLGSEASDKFTEGFTTNFDTTSIETSTSVIETFLSALNEAIGVADFETPGTTAVNDMMSAFSLKLTESTESIGETLTEAYMNIGTNTINSIMEGITESQETFILFIDEFCTRTVTEFQVMLPILTFRTLGSNIINAIALGINSRRFYILTVVGSLCTAVINAFKSGLNRSKTFPIGQDAAEGIREGIESKINEIAEAAIRAAEAAVKAARARLKVASPSKVFYEIGEYVDLGLIKGMESMISVIETTSENMADNAINPVKDVVKTICDILGDGGDVDVSPKIVPLVDLSNVKKSAEEIEGMFNGPVLDISKLQMDLKSASIAFNGRTNAKTNGTINSKDKGIINNNYNMVQNNYSPKALDRDEIYRRTNNQFSALKNMVGAT